VVDFPSLKGTIDDLIIFRMDKSKFLIIKQKDLYGSKGLLCNGFGCDWYFKNNAVLFTSKRKESQNI
jgi:hypothetical protein